MQSVNLVLIQGSLTRPDLKREIQYLEKLLYKNRNQHRGSQHFRRLQEVHKLLRAWNELSAPELVASLSGSSERIPDGMHGHKQPEHNIGLLLLQRIMAGCNRMEALFSAIRKAGAALSAQLALTFFVPLCLTGLAIVARMQVLAAQWVHDAVIAYNSLIEHVCTLPLQTPPPGLQLPQMLKCAWEGRTPRVIPILYPEGDSFEKRVQESARLARLQKLRPESKAALLQLFGDEFDIGERVERSAGVQHASSAGVPSAGAQAPEASRRAHSARQPCITVFEDRAPDSGWSVREGSAHVSIAFSTIPGLALPAPPYNPLPAPATPNLNLNSAPPALNQEPPAHPTEVLMVESDEDSPWSADERSGTAAFGSVDYVVGPVSMGPAEPDQAEQSMMQVSSSLVQVRDLSQPGVHEGQVTAHGEQCESSLRRPQDTAQPASQPTAGQAQQLPAERPPCHHAPAVQQIASAPPADVAASIALDEIAGPSAASSAAAAAEQAACQEHSPLRSNQSFSSTPLYTCQLQGLGGPHLGLLAQDDAINAGGASHDHEAVTNNSGSLPPGVEEDRGTELRTFPALDSTEEADGFHDGTGTDRDGRGSQSLAAQALRPAKETLHALEGAAADPTEGAAGHSAAAQVLKQAAVPAQLPTVSPVAPGLDGREGTSAYFPVDTGAAVSSTQASPEAPPVTGPHSRGGQASLTLPEAPLALLESSVPSAAAVMENAEGAAAGATNTAAVASPAALMKLPGAQLDPKAPSTVADIGINEVAGNSAAVLATSPALDSKQEGPAGTLLPTIGASSRALLAPSKAQLKRARRAAAMQRSAQAAPQAAGQKRAWEDWLAPR